MFSIRTPTYPVPRPLFLLTDDTDVSSWLDPPEIIWMLLKLLEKEDVLL